MEIDEEKLRAIIREEMEKALKDRFGCNHEWEGENGVLDAWRRCIKCGQRRYDPISAYMFPERARFPNQKK